MNKEKDPEALFLEGLLELQYDQDVTKSLEQVAKKVPWASGWPDNNRAFWNAEAFMWGHKIDKEVRELISQELRFLAHGNNLDLGCGSYSYIPSVGFDLSSKMLDFNKNCVRKIAGNLEEALPFHIDEFDSVTAVFVLNYVKNCSLLLKEVYRVLKEDGVFVVVLSARGINAWQKQKEVNSFSLEEWGHILVYGGFRVSLSQKQELWFFRCEK